MMNYEAPPVGNAAQVSPPSRGWYYRCRLYRALCRFCRRSADSGVTVLPDGAVLVSSGGFRIFSSQLSMT